TSNARHRIRCRRRRSWPWPSAVVLDEAHAPRDAAGELVADRARVLRDLFDRKAAAPEHDRVADLRVGMLAQVERDEVHRHAADDRRARAVDEDRRAGTRVAWIAVAVTDRGDADR